MITLPLISKKSYLSFSIHNQYTTGVMMIPLTLVKINTKKSKIKTNLKKVLQRHKCLNTYIQPVHKIIHVPCLMNFYIVLTSNWIIKLQMIGNLEDNYETWWKRPNSAHAHSPKAINNTWTNMYTVLWKIKTFVNTLSPLLIILSEFWIYGWLCWFKIVNVIKYLKVFFRGMDTSFIRF